jgi:predicted nucleic acid-binding protein
VNATTVIVLDASMLVTAAGSPDGGSAVVLRGLGGSLRHSAALSQRIRDEAIESAWWKLGEAAAFRLQEMLRELNPLLIELRAVDLTDLPPSVAAKDHHVIDCCLSAGASVCLTLDRRHLLTPEVRQWGAARGLRFLTPGEFLAEERARDESDAYA